MRDGFYWYQANDERYTGQPEVVQVETLRFSDRHDRQVVFFCGELEDTSIEDAQREGRFLSADPLPPPG